jgi:hypothetical protein
VARYHLDRAAFREHVLNAPWMVEAMKSRAERGKVFAESIAPVDTGEYAASFEVESGTHGGLHGDRAYATLKNTDPAAPYVEFGNGHDNGEHVLTRALDAM